MIPKTAIPANISDRDLAARIDAGDQDAFAFLMRRHNQRLFRAARSVLRNDAEAEDAVQEGYLLAYSSIGQFRFDATLSTWLTRIVVNVALGQLRKTTRRSNIIYLQSDADVDNNGTGVNSHDAQLESPLESPEGSAMRAQARELLETSIEALPEAFRTIFVLRAIEEMSVEDVSLCLGIPEATVRSRFFRARSQLRTALLTRFDVALDDAFSFDGARCDRIVNTVLARVAATSG